MRTFEEIEKRITIIQKIHDENKKKAKKFFNSGDWNKYKLYSDMAFHCECELDGLKYAIGEAE